MLHPHDLRNCLEIYKGNGMIADNGTKRERIHRACLNIIKPVRSRTKVDVDISGRRLTLRIGNRSRYMELNRPLPNFENFDFAIFTCAALAMRRALPLRCDLPISQSAACAIARLSSLLQLRVPFAATPLDLELTNIQPDKAPMPDGGILCISGGVDSTYSAATTNGYTHGLSIRGFDFPIDNDDGYLGRQARMQKVADKFSLDLIELKTNLSLSYKSYFDSYSVMFLTTCLGFAGYGLGKGGFSGDLPSRGQIVSRRLSTVAGIDAFVSTRQFPIELTGDIATRGEKLKMIFRKAPELMPHLGFCFDEQSAGGNCGTCVKCMRTRLSMDYAGLDQTLIFDQRLDASEFYRTLDAKTPHEVILALTHIDAGIDELPDGPQRRNLLAAADALRHQWHGLRAPYTSGTNPR